MKRFFMKLLKFFISRLSFQRGRESRAFGSVSARGQRPGIRLRGHGRKGPPSVKLFMKLVIVFSCLFLITGLCGHSVMAEDPDGYLSVTGPCELVFPKDHGSHPGYRTEWWYYTGNLEAESGDRYGFQLTFFRSQINVTADERHWPQPSSVAGAPRRWCSWRAAPWGPPGTLPTCPVRGRRGRRLSSR